LRVRPARPTDAPEIVGWFPDAEAVLRWGGHEPPFPVEPEWLAREFRSRSRAYFVATHGEEGEEDLPLGLIGMRRHFRHGRVHLVRVGVKPDRRGEGIAARLIEAVAGVARAGGADRLTLNVYGSNAAAVRAYEKAGFAQFGTVATGDDPSGLVIRMARRL
jgi:ribosomal protein S18 acetylase RimI-like enzyme